MEWRKPELICYFTEDLLCNVKARAGSQDCTSGDYYEDMLCVHMEYEDSSSGDGDGDEGFDGCTVLGQCIEVGPLFGCDLDLQCSTMAPIFR